MKKKKNLKVWAILGVCSVLVVVSAVSLVRAYVSNEPPERVIENVEVYNEAPNVQQEENLGALASPDIPFNWLRVGGVEFRPVAMDARLATNTPCSIQAPAATSTLLFASVSADLASTTDSTWQWHKSATAYATTTDLSSVTAVGVGPFSLMASSSASNLYTDTVNFGPNEWLVLWGQNSISASKYSMTNGECRALWIRQR